jgi:small subunit ribosomal protein S17
MPRNGSRSRLEGTVISNKMDKSVIVVVERRTRHTLYKKYVMRRKKYAAHDDKNLCKIGDVVQIITSRPFSKTKQWAVSRILQTVSPSIAVTEKEIPQ